VVPMHEGPNIPSLGHSIIEAIGQQGGHVLVVGGCVRDLFLGGEPSKDIDFEVYHLKAEQLEDILSSFGEVIRVGRAFGVFKLKGQTMDFSLPRKDNTTGAGHRDFEVQCDPDLSFEEASRRRDLRINSMGYDPMNHKLLDPHGGLSDIREGRLSATDPVHFGEDPLRALRVMQFAARFRLNVAPDLLKLMSVCDLNSLPGERIWGEFEKFLMQGKKPSLGLKALLDSGLVSYFPELEALVGLEQAQDEHPEGDAWTHTLITLDVASASNPPKTDRLILMFAALTHDFGKQMLPSGQTRDPDGEIHTAAGAKLAESFLERMMAPRVLIKQVSTLVREQHSPENLVTNASPDPAYHQLARRLDRGRTDMNLLAMLAWADRVGRGGELAYEMAREQNDTFLSSLERLGIKEGPLPDLVQGRHLVNLGLKPGPHFKAILQLCRQIQDQRPECCTQEIVDIALALRSK
jgi:tRNA nucleotidyltransferase (CCA-adding enzyme)